MVTGICIITIQGEHGDSRELTQVSQNVNSNDVFDRLEANFRANVRHDVKLLLKILSPLCDFSLEFSRGLWRAARIFVLIKTIAVSNIR